MRHAIIGVIIGGALGWTLLERFHMIATAPPWRRWLPASIANNDFFLALFLFIAVMIGLAWDRYSKSK